MILAFINGCCSIQYQQQHKLLMFHAIALVVEMICFIQNLNLVLPHCFFLNALQTFLIMFQDKFFLKWENLSWYRIYSLEKWLDIVGSKQL